MQFQVKVWVSPFAKSASIFGIVNAASPMELPPMTAKGHWVDYRSIDESALPAAREAKKSIAEIGYYLMGGGIGAKAPAS